MPRVRSETTWVLNRGRLRPGSIIKIGERTYTVERCNDCGATVRDTAIVKRTFHNRKTDSETTITTAARSVQISATSEVLVLVKKRKGM